MTNRVSGSIGQQIGKAVLGWLNPPWKPGAAALTGAVAWYLFFPVLQAETIEFRNALIDQRTETDPTLRNIALVTHRAIFIDMSVFCEVLFVGAISVIILNFAVFLWRRTLAALREFHSANGRNTHRAVHQRTPDGVLRLDPPHPGSQDARYLNRRKPDDAA